jgi:hypothetical protein
MEQDVLEKAFSSWVLELVDGQQEERDQRQELVILEKLGRMPKRGLEEEDPLAVVRCQFQSKCDGYC